MSLIAGLAAAFAVWTGVDPLWALPTPEVPAVADPALAAAQARYAAMDWAPLAKDRALKADGTGPAVLALRTRLAAEGYLPAAEPADPLVFDPELTALVTAWQAAHGLEPDGRVGPETLTALNIPASARAAQIEANLIRATWLPAEPPLRRIEVDIPATEAVVFDAGQPVLTMRVVVGDGDHKTPMLATALEAVVFNPPWKVPASIAKAELWPKEARQPGYLAANGFVATDGRLEQAPGPGNALGQVKFDLKSPFGVFLHDTPTKGAFARWRRTLSHGCVRLEKPRELAALLLADQGFDATAVDAAIATGETRSVAVSAPLPLVIVYRTVVPDGAGGVVFRPDVYGWDAELIAWLSGATP